MKKYILIAGVNGVGKSTLFYLLEELNDMPRINTDDIVRKFGKWDNFSDVLKAGKIVIQRMTQYIKEGITFNQETTLCGKSIIKNIRFAVYENGNPVMISEEVPNWFNYILRVAEE